MANLENFIQSVNICNTSFFFFFFSGAIDMSAYPAGVYVVRCGGYSTKIVK